MGTPICTWKHNSTSGLKLAVRKWCIIVVTMAQMDWKVPDKALQWLTKQNSCCVMFVYSGLWCASWKGYVPESVFCQITRVTQDNLSVRLLDGPCRCTDLPWFGVQEDCDFGLLLTQLLSILSPLCYWIFVYFLLIFLFSFKCCCFFLLLFIFL